MYMTRTLVMQNDARMIPVPEHSLSQLILLFFCFFFSLSSWLILFPRNENLPSTDLACSPIARPFLPHLKSNQGPLQYRKQSNSINMHARGMWQCWHLISPIENITNHPVVNHRAASRQNNKRCLTQIRRGGVRSLRIISSSFVESLSCASPIGQYRLVKCKLHNHLRWCISLFFFCFFFLFLDQKESASLALCAP